MRIGWLRGHIASQRHFMRSVFEERKALLSLQEGSYIEKIMNRLYLSGTCENPGVPGPWI